MTGATNAKQRKERRWLTGSAIFVTLVFLTGFVFAAFELADDPFVNMSDIASMRQMLAETEQNPDALLLEPADVAEQPAARAARRASPSPRWAKRSTTLRDLCAATAVVIGISYLIKLLKWVAGAPARRRAAASAESAAVERAPGQMRR